MHTREQLEAMISTLKENVDLAKKLIEKNPGDESAKMILDSQRKTLHDYQERLNNMRVGRPVIGVTKKVSLTLSENDWKCLDEKAEGNRSQFLRETVTSYLGSESEWSNQAALGYAVLAAKELNYSHAEIKKLIGAIYYQFDMKTVDEAKKIYSERDY